jgi:hypothetical protein
MVHSHKIQKSVFIIFSLVSTLSLLRCAIGPNSNNDLVSLRFQFDGEGKKDLINLSLLQRSHDSSAPPRSLNSFTCLALNIVGPGIASSESTKNVDFYLSHLRQGGYCAYKGITSQTIPIGTPRC